MKKKLLALTSVILLTLTACGENTTSDSTSVDSDDIPMETDPATDYEYDETVTNEDGSASYEIFVRSYYDYDGDGIGDLLGVREKIPYLADLGIKTVWLMPIHPSPSYHGYDVTDYYDVNPDYGTLDDFDALIATANEYNIDIMIDLVINHCSIEHQYFLDSYNDYINGNTSEDSKADWFNWGYNDHYYNGVAYESYFDAGMPDFNLDSEGVRAELENIIAFWIGHGVSGFRLDGVYYYYRGAQTSNIEFLNWIKETAVKYNPDIYIVGECWASDGLLNSYFGSEVDSFFCFGQASGGDSSMINFIKGYGKCSNLAATIEKNETQRKASNPNSYSSYFLSNHDQDRIAKNFTKTDTYKAAVSFYMLLPGTSWMYYGEEIALKGTRTTTPDDYSDVKRRLPMIWSSTDKTGECDFPEQDRQDLNTTEQVTDGVYDQYDEAFSLLKHYKKVINVRNKYSFIKNGIFTSMCDELNTDEKSVMAYKITSADSDDYIIVVHNFSYNNVQVTSPGTEIVDEINTSHKIPTIEDGVLTLGAYSTVVLQ